MGLFGNLFGKKPAAPSSEHSVQVCFKLSDDKYGEPDEVSEAHRFSDVLADLIEQNNAGEFDGDEFGECGGTLYMYGADADRLYSAIESALKTWQPLKGGYVIKRYGPPGSQSVRIDF